MSTDIVHRFMITSINNTQYYLKEWHHILVWPLPLCSLAPRSYRLSPIEFYKLYVIVLSTVVFISYTEFLDSMILMGDDFYNYNVLKIFYWCFESITAWCCSFDLPPWLCYDHIIRQYFLKNRMLLENSCSSCY